MTSGIFFTVVVVVVGDDRGQVTCDGDFAFFESDLENFRGRDLW